MPPSKEIIVIGDIEMGAGNLTDDFIADRKLASLIQELAARKHPVDLVFNGDTFDFLKCPSQVLPHSVYPRHITASVSLAKIRLIHQAHASVFKALAQFVNANGKKVYFILGNHDPDLVYPEVQEEIRRLLGDSSAVKFPGLRYTEKGVHVEHGHQYDFVFKINTGKLFLNYKGSSILNLPFVSFGLLSQFMHMKEENPFIERIFPRPALLTHHRIIARKLNKYTLSYFLKSMAYYPFRFYSDPTYAFPSNLFQELYQRLRTVHWDVGNITAAFMKESKIRKQIVVLGHIHEKRIARGRRRTIIHPGSWRDEYQFNPKTRELIPRRKRYVQILLKGNKPTYNIIDIPPSRSIFYFDDVLRDELGHIKKAAAEEGFTVSFL